MMSEDKKASREFYAADSGQANREQRDDYSRMVGEQNIDRGQTERANADDDIQVKKHSSSSNIPGASESDGNATDGGKTAGVKSNGNASDEEAGVKSNGNASDEGAGAAGDDRNGADDDKSDVAKTGDADDDKSDDAEAAKESERYMRLMAEFQNYKKRTAKEKSDIHAYANEKIITQLLEILDNFERALASDISDENAAYADGMKLIYDQLKAVLDKAGLKEVKSEGETFDPTKHNAVMAVDDPEMESGKVKQVLQKGYELNGKVIRPAMVVVTS